MKADSWYVGGQLVRRRTVGFGRQLLKFDDVSVFELGNSYLIGPKVFLLGTFFCNQELQRLVRSLFSYLVFFQRQRRCGCRDSLVRSFARSVRHVWVRVRLI